MASYTFSVTVAMADQAALDTVIGNIRAAYAAAFPQYAAGSDGLPDALHTFERAEPQRILDVLRHYLHQQAIGQASGQQTAAFIAELEQAQITAQVVAQ